MAPVMIVWAAGNVALFWDTTWMAVLNAWAVGILMALHAPRRADRGAEKS